MYGQNEIKMKRAALYAHDQSLCIESPIIAIQTAIRNAVTIKMHNGQYSVCSS